VSHRSKPSSCVGCALHDHGNDFSAVEGTCANGTMLVAEASGEMEQRDQLPLRPYAPSGAVLERCLRRMGLDRKQFAITNCVRCRPRHNWLEGSPFEYAALRHCRPNLDQAIADYRPRCIVSLGGVALRELTGEAGEARGVTHLAGYCLPLAGGNALGERYRQEARATLNVASGQRTPTQQVEVISAGSGGCGQITQDPHQPVPVLANFHPSYLRRGKASHQGVFSRIIQRGLAIASGRDRSYMWCVDPGDPATWGTPEGGRLQYLTRPNLDTLRSFYYYLKENSGLPFSADIETPESKSMDEDAREGFSDTHIRQIQFSYQKYTGIAVPFEEPFRSVAIDILHLRNKMYGHQWDNFDHKVLRAASARDGWVYQPRERVYDTLDMFHHWQPDLPAHLQFACSFINFPFPWKHMHTLEHEPFYGCCDVDSDLQLGEYLTQVLKKDNLWGEGDAYSLTLGYTGQEREVRPVLAAMEDRGVPIDDAKRIALGEEFRLAAVEIAEKLMPLFPESAKKLDPYKTFPPELKKLPESEWSRLFKEPDKWKCKCSRENKMDALTCGKCGKPQEDGRIKAGKWYRYGQREVDEVTADIDLNTVTIRAIRWCYIPEFNPNSRNMLIEYMKAKGHKVPKSKEEDDEGNQKDTTAAKELQRLAVKTGDRFYNDVINYRGLTKLRGTYIDGFKPGADGRVHTTFTFQTAIAQLSARNPNTTNFPKLKPTPALAKAIRGMICADEGYILTEVDFKSCHVITLGLLAGDDNYTRLGRLDIHSAVAGHFLQLWDVREILKESDEQLLARFKWLKSDPERKRIRDDQAKHAILGIGNGLKAKGLYERYMEQFPPRQCPECKGTTKVPGIRGLKLCPMCSNNLVRGMQTGMQVAADVLSVCEMLFDKVFKYQDEQVMEAHHKQKLGTPFGHMRRFYEAKVWNNKMKGGPGWDHGDQSEEAIAYRLANTAHAHMREVMKELYRQGLDDKFGLFNMVHDSLMLHHREELAEDAIREVVPVMMAPSKVMPGLWLGVEASQGKRWNQMQEVTLPSTLTPLATMAAGNQATQEVAI